MIHLSDALTISYTKLKTRKIRLLITVGVSSLLFALLIMLVTVSNGIFYSIQSFESEGFGSRYMVSASSGVTPQGFSLNDKNVWARAQAIHIEAIAAKKDAAKALGVSYDPASEISPIGSFKEGNQTQEYLNQQSPAATKALFEYSSNLRNNFKSLEDIAAPYHPVKTYSLRLKAVQGGSFAAMLNGKENFKEATSTTNAIGPTVSLSNGFNVVDDSLAKPFIFPSTPNLTHDANAVPIIVSYKMAEQLLGTTPVSSSTSTADKLARMRQVQKVANGLTISMCYRNSASDAQIQAALEYKQGNDNGDITYALPNATSCGGAKVSKDTRTAQQRSLQARQDKFNNMFGALTTPDQEKLNFRIIGLMPDSSNASTSPNDTFGIIQSLVGSSLNGMAAVPASMYSKLPNLDRLERIFQPVQNSYLSVLNTSHIVEFNSASDARNFIDAKACSIQSDNSCGTIDKPFVLSSFGSNSIALADLQKKLTLWMDIAALTIILIAAVFSGSIIGRVISDSRKESAVFRAIGFKKIDIIITYVIYALLLAILISVVAIVVGITGASLINMRFSEMMTQQAQLAYSSLDLDRSFSLFRLDIPKTLLTVALVFSSVLLGSLLPIVSNARRNPMKDMREQ